MYYNHEYKYIVLYTYIAGNHKLEIIVNNNISYVNRNHNKGIYSLILCK